MDWPHDPDGEEGSEGMRKYGMAIIVKKVDEEDDFPLSAEAFVAAHGDDPIRLNHERVVPLREVFDHVDTEEFENIRDLHRAIGAAMRRGGFWEYAAEAID
ncbi:hypothetical protein BRD17_05935 [Halobacteriales archaeon SW_7_68_16]|nr:MAG: hypothetical protein BRD17_05935 [Halobacteriales archaeon SW_7_68_16]